MAGLSFGILLTGYGLLTYGWGLLHGCNTGIAGVFVPGKFNGCNYDRATHSGGGATTVVNTKSPLARPGIGDGPYRSQAECEKAHAGMAGTCGENAAHQWYWRPVVTR